LTVDQVTLQPRTIGALTDYSRRLLLQSSVDIENLVRRDLAQQIAIEVENQALNGTGTGSYPLGILNVTGINTESGVAAFSDFVNAEAALSTDNALMGNLGYLMNSALRGTLKTTEKGFRHQRHLRLRRRQHHQRLQRLRVQLHAEQHCGVR
jgi:HK97 family phage major capsid protein